MTWIFYEFYLFKATKRIYSCICTKSEARQSCAVADIFTGVPTLPTVLLKITIEGVIMGPLILSSVLSNNALTTISSAPTHR